MKKSNKEDGINIQDIKPNPGNPRTIKDDRFKKLVKSIQEFPAMMELRPIVVDDQMVILGGNMRYHALKHLAYKLIPETWVKKASDLTEEEKRRFIIADNVGFGDWDYEQLAESWTSDPLPEWGMDFEERDDVDIRIEEKEIKGFVKTHILLSFSPDLFIEIKEYLQKIKDTVGVEYEQASN